VGGSNALAFLAALYLPFPVLAGPRSDSSDGSVNDMGGGSFGEGTGELGVLISGRAVFPLAGAGGIEPGTALGEARSGNPPAILLQRMGPVSLLQSYAKAYAEQHL
jgi:hypothetical protein